MVLVLSDLYVKDHDLGCSQKIIDFVTDTTLDLLIIRNIIFFHVTNLHLRTLKLQSPAIYHFLWRGII